MALDHRVGPHGPPRLLSLTSVNPPPFAFPIDLVLAPDANGATIALRHRQIPDELPVRDLGPGWEFYLEQLVAAIEGREGAPFEEFMADLAEEYGKLV